MKPILGITANYSTNEHIGTSEGIGAENNPACLPLFT